MGWWVFICTQDTKPTISHINSQAGLYFDDMGQILFYTANWKIITYADLKPIQSQWQQVK
jgi:hypothetical protein